MSTKGNNNPAAAGARDRIGADVELGSRNFAAGLDEARLFPLLFHGCSSGRPAAPASFCGSSRVQSARHSERVSAEPVARNHAAISRPGDPCAEALELRYRLRSTKCAGGPSRCRGQWFACLTFDGGCEDVIDAGLSVLSAARRALRHLPADRVSGRARLGRGGFALEEDDRRARIASACVIEPQGAAFRYEHGVEKYAALRISRRDGCGRWRRRISPSRSTTLCKRYSVDLAALSRAASMDWNDLAKLAADPLVTIGSATGELSGAVRTSKASRRAARDGDGQGGARRPACAAPVRHFAYPFGDRAEPGAASMSSMAAARARLCQRGVERLPRIVEAQGAYQSARAAAGRPGTGGNTRCA